jgi:hypothetical protein
VGAPDDRLDSGMSVRRNAHAPLLMRSIMLRLVAAWTVLLLAAACAPPEAVEPTPTPPEPQVLPLTGLPVDDPAVLERPVLAIKVDNLRPARPQAGVEHADLVMVELVEAATRLLALYHSRDPGTVGPVRSGRLLQADILPPFNPVFAMSGAHGPVERELREALPVVFEEGEAGGWTRDPDRSAPHNLYATAADLWEGAPELALTEAFWAFDDATPEGGSEVAAFEVVYPGAGSSGWEWDAGEDRWLRLQDGEAHVSADGARLAADTVIVVRLPTTGQERRPVDPIGEGEATVFRDGEQFDARWRKPAREGHMEILTPDGEPFPIKPGQSWLELLPVDGSLDVGAAGE